MSARGPGSKPLLGAQIGIRARSVLVAVVVVLLALLLGGSGLVYLLRINLEGTVQSSANARSLEVANLILERGATVAAGTLADESRSGQLVQIIGPDGTVIGASNRLVATTPMSDQRPAAGRVQSAEIDIDHVGQPGDWMVVSRGVAYESKTYVVQVAVPVRVARETVATVAVFLLAGTPLLLAGVAAAVWLLVGRALGAVERIRQEVATIDARGLAQRVEVPPTRDELGTLAATMNTMLDRLESSDRAQRSFVSDASHELRSPLATLTTATELALTADEETRTRLLGTISLELARVRSLVDNLMTLARTDADDLVVRHEDVDLDDLVDHEVHRLRATSSKKVLARVEPLRVFGDEHRLAQAIRNLVDNAERHADTTIRLTLGEEHSAAVLWVDNDGAVIPPADRERIFERFVRLDDSRSRDAGGSGLGLSIARTAVESHGGQLMVADAPDGWCRFSVRLPLATAGD
jgi:signal transduction histidine kinase